MMRRIQWLTMFLSAVVAAGVLYAQQNPNPMSILGIGPATAVTTTLPVSGTVTANAGTNLNTSALALDATLATIDTDLKANITLHAGTNVIGHVIADTGSTTAVTGNVTAVQGTGSNLHVVVDTAPTTAVTGTFWQATQPVSGTFWQATQPVSGTVTTTPPSNASTNIAQMNGVTTSMNTGSSDTGTQRVVLADGLLECLIVSAASTNATNCKAGAGNFFGYDIYNTTTTVYYLRLYNTVGAPTCSSATGFIRSIPVPPAGAAGAVGGAIRVSPIGVAYGTGVSFCLTGGSSSTDNTNAAVGILGTVLYR